MNWKLWAYGLITGIIGGAASAASSVFVIPLVVNGITAHQLIVVTGWQAVFGGIATGLAYLKTHPGPEWSGVDRRGNIVTATVTVDDGKTAAAAQGATNGIH